jgi:hypothetical protein
MLKNKWLWVLLCNSLQIISPVFAITFEDTTGVAGINSLHHPAYTITGQAWGDYDDDGFEDLYLTDGFGANTLYRNVGNGTFVISPVSESVSLPDIASGGATFVDYDNDGDQDLLVLTNGVDKLFLNTGSTFVDVTASAGLVHEGIGESAAWGDFNGDGYLDLYITNFRGITFGPLDQDHLYLNDGDGSFSNVSALLDIQRMLGPAFAVTFMDYDDDGDQDIYVINDKFFGNVLWRNDGPGCDLWCFTDVSVASGANRPIEGMGIAVGDYDLDGDDDLYFSGDGEMALLQSQLAQGSPVYSEVTVPAGVDVYAEGWGSVFVDFDNDGWEDLFLSTSNDQEGRTDRVFRNTGEGDFDDVSDSSGASDEAISMGVAYADYDRDGRVDLLVGNFYATYRLYRNTSDAGDWLSVRLTGAGPVNRDAVGAVAVLELSDGRMLRRRVHIGSSFGADHQRDLHFGLGKASPVSLNIRWPDGTQKTLTTLPINTRIIQVYTDESDNADSIMSSGFEN